MDSDPAYREPPAEHDPKAGLRAAKAVLALARDRRPPAPPPLPRVEIPAACVHSVWHETLTPDELECASCGTVTIREAE